MAKSGEVFHSPGNIPGASQFHVYHLKSMCCQTSICNLMKMILTRNSMVHLQPWKSHRIRKPKPYVGRLLQSGSCPGGNDLKWMWLDFQINVLQTRINEQQKLWVTVNEECEPRGCCVVFAVRVLTGHERRLGQWSENRAGRWSR